MASASRQELVAKFRKELAEWWENGESHHGKDTTHIQMASVDEMMSAYGYVPRRVARYPHITDGRFGYQLVKADKGYDSRMIFMSLEAAVRMHNGTTGGFRTLSSANRGKSRSAFARNNRIVETVSLQRNKRWGNDASGLKSQTRWVKFLEQEND